jgi:type VI secretion system protein ImpM
MPEAITGLSPGGWLQNAAIGFHGKIPARGDFVQGGLPRAFIDPWDDWMRRSLAASRTALGEAWLPAWLEAPVWRFALTSGTCGPDAVIGLWMPSVDRVGRYYPLTLAAVAPNADCPTLLSDGAGFLDAAECAGRDALENELAPEELAARLAASITAPATRLGKAPPLCAPKTGLWWTEGAPRVPSSAFASADLPDESAFSAMLASGSAAVPPLLLEQAR